MAHTKVTKTHSQNTGVANTFSYSGSFDVFKGTEVVVTLDAIALTFTATTINESASPREYTVDTAAKTIHIGGADLSSGTIVIRPQTDMGAPTPRATYTPGASITSEDLNNNQTQLLRKAMEYDETKMSSTGDTMTGDLTLGQATKIIFEGATDDAHETTLTVTDPTADRTITLPNVTGTVVTTGDTATVTATMLAADSVDSSELVDGSIDTSHISTGAVTTAKLGSDAVDGSKLADDAVNSEHYTDGSIDTAHIADLNVTTAKIAADAITGAKIADDAIDSEHYVDGSIDTAHIAADAVTQAKIADDAVGADQLASDAVVSASIADGSIVNADVNASAAIAHTKIAAIPDGQILVGSGSTVPTAVAVSGDVTLANSGAVTIASNAVEIGMIGCEQTTISDSDSHIPTSGAVVDYVAAQLLPFGGFEAIDDEDNFPTTVPAAGVVISIKDATGVTVDGSGSSNTARTAGNGSDNVTINGFPSSMNSAAVPASTGLLVTSTGSSHTYNFHRLLPTTDDVRQLSDDVNDFFARYRIAGSAPGSSNDEGDLYFNTSTNKMNVYDGSSWGEVTSTGDFKILVLTNQNTTDAPTYNGSIVAYDLKEGTTGGSAAAVTTAAQLIVSVNGVIQKPNAGTNPSGLDGFVLSASDEITFCAGPPSGADVFIMQCGSAVTIPTPGDNTVTSAKIVDGAIVNADINASAAIAGSKLADDSIAEVKLDIHNAPSGTDKYLGYTSNGMEWAVPADATKLPLAGGTITGDVVFDNATNAGNDLTWDMSDNALEFDDNVKATFGDGADIQIYHNATNSFIKNATGHFKICGDSISFRNAADGEDLALFTADGACKLGYDNSFELETKSGGVKLLGHSESVITALTSAASLTIDFSLSNHFSCTMGHNITFNNPSTESVGQSGTIVLTQDGTGSRTASWGSQFLWAGGTAPTLSTAAAAVDRIDYFVAAADKIHCVASLAMA